MSTSMLPRHQLFFLNLYYRLLDLLGLLRVALFPRNVVRVTALKRNTTDRKALMLHAVMRMLVDYVEIDRPYVPFALRPVWKPIYGCWPWPRRCTDLAVMWSYVTPEHWPAQSWRLQGGVTYLAFLEELLAVYAWYVSGLWQFSLEGHTDFERAYNLAREHDAACQKWLERAIALRPLMTFT